MEQMPYPYDMTYFQTLRRIIRFPKKRVCPMCGGLAPLTRHRIVPGRYGGRYTRDNIVHICRACHDKLER